MERKKSLKSLKFSKKDDPSFISRTILPVIIPRENKAGIVFRVTVITFNRLGDHLFAESPDQHSQTELRT